MAGKEKLLRPSNFLIEWSVVERPGGYGPAFLVSDDFVEFCKRQSVKREKYEEIGRDIVKKLWPKTIGDDSSIILGGICHWDEDDKGNFNGLLHHVRVPGNAAGVALERQGALGYDWAYHPHNIDNYSQALAILGVVIPYLSDMEKKIKQSQAL